MSSCLQNSEYSEYQTQIVSCLFHGSAWMSLTLFRLNTFIKLFCHLPSIGPSCFPSVFLIHTGVAHTRTRGVILEPLPLIPFKY